jgi:DNA-directed RNA polymerase specialized sigma24 family protein
VNRERAIEQLPETHAAALRLRGRGYDDDAIAAALSLPPEAVAELLRIADQKLAAVVAGSSTSSGPPTAPSALQEAADSDAKGVSK